MRFSKAVVKHRVLILIIAVVLMVPSLLGMFATRVNYDMLDYLPEDIDTVNGQNELLEEFGKGAFSLIIVENMPDKDIAALVEKFEAVDHVETVLWYSSLTDISFPKEFLPDALYDEFNTDNATMMAVFFDTSTSADITMDAIREIRSIAGKQCFVSGMSALVTDLKDLCEQEEPIYVGLAVLFACLAMLILLDGWLVPFVFLASIGMMILMNLGSNYFFGEISYITKALSAVLQLAVTMDYSIFLWHSYNEQREKYSDHKDAMTVAIQQTLASVVGSSITTVAGFVALCFMTFTLGRDLGIVMAKGVILGVIGCVTVLPALILVFDKPLQKTKHRSLIPNMTRFAGSITKVFPVFLIIFALLIAPALYGYNKTNNEVYYDMGECLPQDMEYVIANSKLSEDFNIASTHMILLDSNIPSKAVRSMINEMEQVDGVKYVLGLESVLGSRVPEEIIPESIKEILESEKWELLLINSEYKVASDDVNTQIDSLNTILKKYDETGMLIGEAPCMKDMIETTDHDFQVVNAISIIAIFIIIALVEKSFSLPFILISVIELAIFINLGLPHYLGQSLPFIAPICISTIQLGATVDYAILMTTRYKSERIAGNDKRYSVSTALAASIPSIIVSGMGLFAATFGVAVYSDIDIISSMCMLMARGAVVSMLCVIFILPSLLMLCDKLICATTFGMKKKEKRPPNGPDAPKDPTEPKETLSQKIEMHV
ncbi:MAG: MMPL family transporter [Clostridiales bacterium]|nr:MMPL family transporter [Clostridiales bacterium]